MEPIFVRVNPENPDTRATGIATSTRSGLAPASSRARASASLHPATIQANGMVLIALGSTSKFLLLEKATRLNRNRLAVQEQVVARQIELKLGEVWHAVEVLCSDIRVSLTGDVENPKAATA